MQTATLDRSLRAHFDVLYRRQRLFGKSAETVRLYGYTFGYFSEYLGREATIDDLSVDQVCGLMEWMISPSGLGLSRRSANKARDQLCALWGFLARKGIVSTWPDVPSLPEPERDPVAWSRDELACLWRACQTQQGSICGVPAGLWWLGLHSVAWDSLERIGALLQVKCVDISSDRGWVSIRPEYRKGQRKGQLVKLHPDTWAILAAMWQPERALLFPWAKSRGALWCRYKALRARAGLPTDRYHSFHALRRTGASFAEAAGVDASRLLGHTSRRVTERYYLSPAVCQRPQGADVLFRPDSRNEKPGS